MKKHSTIIFLTIIILSANLQPAHAEMPVFDPAVQAAVQAGNQVIGQVNQTIASFQEHIRQLGRTAQRAIFFEQSQRDAVNAIGQQVNNVNPLPGVNQSMDQTFGSMEATFKTPDEKLSAQIQAQTDLN